MTSALRKLGHPLTVAVRPLTPRDYAAFSALMDVNSKRFAESGLALLPETQSTFDTWIDAGSASPTQQDSLKVVFGSWVRVDGVERLAGFVGVETVHRFHGAGVWYGTDKSLQGRGLTKTAVLLAICNFAERAAEAGMKPPPRWVLHALPRNERSCALAQSIGFERDDMLDYTRSTSSRGGPRFNGFLLSRPLAQLHAEASARLAAASMHAALTGANASDDARPTRRCIA